MNDYTLNYFCGDFINPIKKFVLILPTHNIIEEDVNGILPSRYDILEYSDDYNELLKKKKWNSLILEDKNGSWIQRL
jgi:hypothetical protein